ncbi:voltage-gated potassium channel [Polymorphobacter multimanifer]|uniref:Voltage-gated potassium channel n=1 Tax=Polymorphobacter multimanifer TaxID=1070431 RepID=A0A841L6B1_9SPHN|nr:potassium channel family protein [Polymorphobacter multimanifer]MBB6228144.1 voltage-gated potassium channel [Polymorphobacter multimanifer]
MILTRASPVSPWRSLGIRVLMVASLIAIAIAGHWFGRDGLHDNLDGVISFSDVLYFTMITVATVGFGDIVPVSEGQRLFATFVVTPIRLFVWLLFVGSAYEFLIKGAWETFRMTKIQEQLKGHIIVAGHGESGSQAVSELLRRGSLPQEILVIEQNEKARAAAVALGVNVMDADATRNATLEAARLKTARALIVSTGRDDTSILVTLTAHGLAPDVPIRTVIRHVDNETLARTAGADTVINPASFAGLLLAGACHGPHTADYLADLAATDGRVSLNERPVAPTEIGKSLADLESGLGLRIYRGELAIGFWEDGARTLKPGDMIVEIVPNS